MRRIFLLLGPCLLAGAALAQTLGSITGEVRDPSGAVAPNAQVTATNTSTSVTRETVTNPAGIYVFPDMIPGPYQVKVTAPGFEPMQSNLEVQVQQAARVDFTLVLGQSTQTVEVSAAAAALTTENATVGTVIEQQRITDLPLNGRDFFQLVALSPNVTYGFTAPAQASGREGGTRASITMSLSGSRPAWQNYTIDGLSNTDPNFNLYIVLPSVDALQEFKVQSGIYPAEFGRELGQVNVSTKPGTNEYHGTAFEFLRNSYVDALSYNFTPPVTPKQPYKQNQYGFTLGGPVRIPKLFNGKNRLFFMSNFEGYKTRTTSPSYFTDIPVAWRNGDFSSYAIALVDPNTRAGGNAQGLCSNATPCTFSLFPNNQIPASRFDKTMVGLINRFDPVPNVNTGNVVNRNFLESLESTVDKNQFNQRIDFNENPNSQWFGRYSWTNEFSLTPGETLDGSTLFTRASQWVLSNTRVISPTKVNEARFGYSSLFNQIGQQLGCKENVNQELGEPLPLQTCDEWGIPAFGLGQGLSGFGNSTNGPYTTNDKILDFVDNFSWIHGKHSFRFGGEYRYDKYPQVGNEYTRGSFTYNGYLTANPNTLSGGLSAADMLMGDLQLGTMTVSLAQTRFNASNYAAYVDDTYKVTPKLTLTLGLRYEIMEPFHDSAGNELNIQLNYPGIPNIANDMNPADQPVYVRTGSGNFYQNQNFVYSGTPNGPGGVTTAAPLTARDGRLGSRLMTIDYNNFAPRFGIAYSPSSKWSVRTGFGVFYSNESKNSVFDLNRGAAGRGNSLSDYGVSGAPTITLQNWISTSVFPVQVAPGFLWGYEHNLPISYSMEYIANVQRQFGNGTTIEAGYNGLLSRKLYFLTNANAPLPGTSAYVLRAPFPAWNLIQFLMAGGAGNYNGASIKLTQRFKSGLTTLVGYTYSKALDDTSSIRGINSDQFVENPRCLFCDYGPSGFDIRQRLTASVLYELPFGQGKPLLSHGGALNEVVGGWQVSTILTVQSGTPLNSIAWDSAGTLQAPVSNRLNMTGINPYLSNPTTADWLNPAAFANPAGGTYGNGGRDNLNGPAWTNVDLAALKNFRIRERKNLQFRAEAFNAPNHPELGNPNLSWGGNTPIPNASFLTITGTQHSMRQVQFALKFNF